MFVGNTRNKLWFATDDHHAACLSKLNGTIDLVSANMPIIKAIVRRWMFALTNPMEDVLSLTLDVPNAID